MKIGRRLLVWFEPRSDYSVMGLWWFGKDGHAVAGFQIIPPWCRPLFSERYGYRKPVLRAFGWRLFGPRNEK
jgi:hypothetical protein